MNSCCTHEFHVECWLLEATRLNDDDPARSIRYIYDYGRTIGIPDSRPRMVKMKRIQSAAAAAGGRQRAAAAASAITARTGTGLLCHTPTHAGLSQTTKSQILLRVVLGSRNLPIRSFLLFFLHIYSNYPGWFTRSGIFESVQFRMLFVQFATTVFFFCYQDDANR